MDILKIETVASFVEKVEVYRKTFSSYSFQDIGMCFFAFYSQLNGAKICGDGFLNFCSKFFLQPSKVNKIFEKKIDFEGL